MGNFNFGAVQNPEWVCTVFSYASYTLMGAVNDGTLFSTVCSG